MGTRKNKAPDVADQLRRAIRGCGLSLNKLAEATGVLSESVLPYVPLASNVSQWATRQPSEPSSGGPSFRRARVS